MSDLPIVVFRHGDVFTNVEPDSLLPRLRLDPTSSPIDVPDGLLIEVDGHDLADGGLIFEPSITVTDPGKSSWHRLTLAA